jgi:hypothetical protein
MASASERREPRCSLTGQHYHIYLNSDRPAATSDIQVAAPTLSGRRPAWAVSGVASGIRQPHSTALWVLGYFSIHSSVV